MTTDVQEEMAQVLLKRMFVNGSEYRLGDCRNGIAALQPYFERERTAAKREGIKEVLKIVLGSYLPEKGTDKQTAKDHNSALDRINYKINQLFANLPE